MKKTVWTFGLISGAIISALMLITIPFEEQIGPERGEILGYTTMVAAFLLIFFGVRSYRDNVGHGRVGFGRAMAVGTLIAVIASACYTVTWEVVYFGLRPDFAQKMFDAQEAKIKASGASQADIDRRLAEARKFAAMYQNPVVNTGMTLIEPLPVGLVIALVSAGILTRKRRIAEQQLA